MKVNPFIFREYDIRGIAEQDLTNEVVYSIGRSFGSKIKRKGGVRICIGRDVRLSSERIKEHIVEGILDAGVDVLDTGVLPTPLLYFSVFHLNTDGGIQITGSHNPKDFNGMKLMEGKDTLYGKGILRLKEIMENENYEKGKGKLSMREDIPGVYIEEISKRVKIEKHFKVAVDPGNGTCGPIVERLFSLFPIEVVGVNMEPDGNFPAHLPDPTVREYLNDLFALMDRDNKFDAGLGFDGDGDRIGTIDDKKRIIFGDKILGILCKKVLKDKPGSRIIFDVKTSSGVIEYIEQLGGIPVIWKTGHSLIKAKLKEDEAPLAGEMSGHIFFKDRFYGFDDAIYAAIRLLEVASEFDMSLSELYDEIPLYYSTPEVRVNCPDGRKFDVVKEITKTLRESYDVLTLDGARIMFQDGFGLVRASNTQPVLVLRFEGKTPERRDEIKDIIVKVLKNYSEVNLSNI